MFRQLIIPIHKMMNYEVLWPLSEKFEIRVPCEKVKCGDADLD
jgi:hypothetical protein